MFGYVRLDCIGAARVAYCVCVCAGVRVRACVCAHARVVGCSCKHACVKEYACAVAQRDGRHFGW